MVLQSINLLWYSIAMKIISDLCIYKITFFSKNFFVIISSIHRERITSDHTKSLLIQNMNMGW